MSIRKLWGSLVTKANVNTFVGEEGNIFFDTTTGELRLSNGITPGGIPIIGGGGGASSFLGLNDTPFTYAGQGGKAVRVRGDATGIEFVDFPQGGAIDSVNGQTGVVVLDTDDIDEGSNLYYTDERVDDRVANLLVGGTGITLTYNDGAGTLTIDGSSTLNDTDDLAEGNSNLYYTNARVDSAIDARVTKTFVDNLNVDSDTLNGQDGAYYLDYTNFTNTPNIPAELTDTDDLAEGAINLYYTDTRANSAIDARVDKTFVDALDVDADTFDGQDSAYYLDYTNLTNTPNIPADTDDIAEGSNLYYTDERVDDRVASLLVAGSNITLTYNDAANILTISATGGGGGPGPGPGNTDEFLPTPDRIDDTDASFFYFGWESYQDSWVVYRQERATSIVSEATLINNPSYIDLDAAWPDRLSLVFN